jgi:hypothetical protein
MSDKWIYRLRDDDDFRKSFINDLSHGIDQKYIDEYSDIINYIIDNRFSIFEREDLCSKMDDDIRDLILPAVRRVYGNIFVRPPSIFISLDDNSERRLQLFQLSFDIDQFLDYLIDMILKNINLLNEFEYLDKSSTLLTLIVDNYVGKLVENVRNCDDITREIRDIKINKIDKK